jgi:hypothetical protein
MNVLLSLNKFREACETRLARRCFIVYVINDLRESYLNSQREFVEFSLKPVQESHDCLVSVGWSHPEAVVQPVLQLSSTVIAQSEGSMPLIPKPSLYTILSQFYPPPILTAHCPKIHLIN